jgi:hypothetical protein
MDLRTRFLAPVAVLIVTGALLSAWNLLRPSWTRLRLGARAALDAAAAAIAIAVLGAHSTELLTAWGRVTGAASVLPNSERIQTWVGLSVAITLGIVALASLGSCLQRIVQILRWDSREVRPAPATREKAESKSAGIPR